MSKSVWDCTMDEILSSFLPEEECNHNTRICFELKGNRKALECPACGNVVFEERQ